MEENPRYVGIDVSKAQVDVAVRPTGQRWAASYNETGVGELVSQLVDIGPAMVLLEATGGLELPLVAALAAAAAGGGGQPAPGSRLRQGHRYAGQDRLSRCGSAGPLRRRRVPPCALSETPRRRYSSLAARRHQVLTMLVSEKNRLGTLSAPFAPASRPTSPGWDRS